ncbi:MAG TPA: AMP-binding protein [Chitinophagaceae bacterium]|nr:AMP-binding protein [Chitinophagaceae bacterium]
MPTPLDQLADCLYSFSGEPAFCIARKFYSYGELEKVIGKIQGKITQAGISAHCKIGIVTYDDIETYASVFSVLFLGHAFVPINPLHPAERNCAIAERSELKLILSSKEDMSIEKFAGQTTIVMTSGNLPEGDLVRVPLHDHQHAYLLFTSGSTGIPKGVPVNIGNLNSFLESFFSLGYKIDHRDRFIQMFDMTFDLSIMSYMVPLCIGACVYTVPFDAIKYVHVLKLLEEDRITFALLIPSVLTNLRKYFAEINLPEMRYSLFCGEALYEDIAIEWSKCLPGAIVQNVYGPTEATIFCMTYEMDRKGNNKSNNGMLCIGKPMKAVGACIVSEGLVPVEQGEKGELCLTGEQVTPGYFKDEQQNKNSFFNYGGSRYYRTGDLAFCDSDGDYFFIGRSDYQVKINGYRVELSELEHHAMQFLKANSAVALAAAAGEGNSQLYLCIENFKGSFEDLTKHLKTQLPSYMMPSKYFSVESFPLSANGKVDRNALMQMIF